MSENKRPFRKFKRIVRKNKSHSMEENIKKFILYNSKNGYFTRIRTLAIKFEIPLAKTWEIVGELLAEDVVEAYHDNRGEMKLCEPGKSFTILKNRKRKKLFKDKK